MALFKAKRLNSYSIQCDLVMMLLQEIRIMTSYNRIITGLKAERKKTAG